MEKWKIAAIMALLVALTAYGYFQSNATGGLNPEASPTGSPTSVSESGGKLLAPPPYLQNWWGKQPPTFSFPMDLWTNTDKPLKLEDFRGKVVLLELWRAECPHCQEAAPVLEQLAEEHKAQGLQIIGVHCSAAKDTVEYNWDELKNKWIPEHGIKYPVAFDEKRAVFDKFNAKKYPSLFIIDRQGIIRYAHEGMTIPLKRELEAALKQVLAGKNPVWPPSKAESAEDAAKKFAPDKD